MSRQRRELSALAWGLVTAVAVFALLVFASHAKAADVAIKGAHWSHHWSSEDVTNEHHEMISIRVDDIFIGTAYNSYRQEGFSGRIWFGGLTKAWTVADDINRYGGDIVVRGYLGATYGYTSFRGGHKPDKDPGMYPLLAGEVSYQQEFSKPRYQQHTHYWEAGFLQFGDATLPALGLGTRF